MTENLPSILGSTEGLEIACAVFTVMDAKKRKEILKTIKDNIKEMSTNKVASLFLVHILNTLDDTTIAHKLILRELIVNFDELIEDKTCQKLFIGLFNP